MPFKKIVFTTQVPSMVQKVEIAKKISEFFF